MTEKPKGRPGRPVSTTAPVTVSLYMPRADAHTLQQAADRRTGGNVSAYIREIARYLRAKQAEEEVKKVANVPNPL